jgi:hypothetical protein
MFAQPKRATTIAQQSWPLVTFDDACLIKRRFYQTEQCRRLKLGTCQIGWKQQVAD